MEKPRFKISWGRLIAAVLLSFLFLGILIPNTGRIVVDHSTIPPTFLIKDRPQQICGIVAILLIPLACIYFGSRRFWLEFIGWVFLVGLFVLASQK
jgi:hypothetical protein